MIIWSGWGILAAVIPLACMFTGDVLIPESEYRLLLRGCVILVSAVIVWVLGRRLNRARDKALVDPETGETVILRSRGGHAFFWIPMQYVAILWALMGLDFIYDGL